MPLISILVILIVFCLILYLITNYLPIDPPIRNIIVIVVVLILILYLLSIVGILPVGTLRLQ
jgi:hypothetical protein